MLYQHRRSAYELVGLDDDRAHSSHQPARRPQQHHSQQDLAGEEEESAGAESPVRRYQRRHSTKHPRKKSSQQPIVNFAPSSSQSGPIRRQDVGFGAREELKMERGARYNPVFGIIEHGAGAGGESIDSGSSSLTDEGEESEPEEEDEGGMRRGLDELEQYELDDTLGEMIPIAFGRRRRREGLFGSSMARSILPGGSWDADEMLLSNRTTLERLTSSGGEDKRSKFSGDEESLEDEERGIRKYAKLIAPHIGLVFLTCTYTLLGAALFYGVENPNETRTKRRQLDLIYARQEDFVAELVALAQTANSTHLLTNRAEWDNLANNYMNEISDRLFLAFEKYFLTAKEVRLNDTIEVWTFSTSVFFSVTVLTTIGYGNPVPITRAGQIICVVFSLIGIPLTLVTIADLGKFLSEHLIYIYGKYLACKYYLFRRVERRRGHPTSKHQRSEHVCDQCQDRGLTEHMQIVEEQKIPAILVLGILVLYTALGGVLMSKLETWSFFTSFYWSFITQTTVGFGDLMPRRDQYILLILLYIVLGLAITTMCIDLVGIQYIRKIHYFGRKIQDARSALAVVGGKVVLVSELYANLMKRRAKNSARDAFIIDNLFVSKHIIPFIPSDIRLIKYIDQTETAGSRIGSVTHLDMLDSCRFCHGSRFRVNLSPYHKQQSPKRAFY